MQTAYGELVLGWLFRGDALTPPSTWSLLLDISLSGDTYVEPTYTGYARAGLPRSTSSWASAVGAGQLATLVDVTWPTLPSDYTVGEQVRRVLISDSATPSGEHVAFVVDLADTVTLTASGTPKLTGGTLVIDAGS